MTWLMTNKGDTCSLNNTCKVQALFKNMKTLLKLQI